jgi:hypothetical protein
MAKRVDAAAELFAADYVGLVDVGAGVLALGERPDLRSPLADLVALAACTLTGRPCRLFIIGPGIDGVLGEPVVGERLADLGAERLARLTPTPSPRCPVCSLGPLRGLGSGRRGGSRHPRPSRGS